MRNVPDACCTGTAMRRSPRCVSTFLLKVSSNFTLPGGMTGAPSVAPVAANLNCSR
jgi:hypothetical protein